MIDARIIIADDNAAVLKALRTLLCDTFRSVAAVQNPQLLPAIMKDNNVDAVLLDMNFGNGKLDGNDGLFWLRRIKEGSGQDVPPAVILITAFGEIDLAVRALKQGADDFIKKPWNNQRLIETITDAIDKRRERIATNDKDEKDIIRSLVYSLIRRYSTTYSKPEPQLSDGAMKKLIDIASEGNIAHLEEAIERATLWNDGNRWEADDISGERGERDCPSPTLEEIEKRLIRSTLKESNHNLVATAQRLGISRQTLYNKMKRYDIY